ncbi:pimeloyl-ACP methyl ester carboxylesterase [Catenulispora sp. EB89]|uniref:alpha/beta fold hydrolase n=1 Tax=Catenulispora sp. EB89 TaxID=3156257 RepID=UPI0035195475
MTASSSSRKKSTTVRAKKALGVGALRTAFGVLEVVAPGPGARWAERIWLSVPKRPWRPKTPIAVSAGEPFTMTVRRSTVRGTVWGTEGPVVYLVHGWGGVAEQLDAFVEPLLAAGCRVVSFDAPGHGRSTQSLAGPGRSTLPEFSESLSTAVDRFGEAHAVIAHSFGAAAVVLSALDGLPMGRLAVVAPMSDPIGFSYEFAKMLGFRERIRGGFLRVLEKRVGTPMDRFDIPQRMRSEDLTDLPPLLIVHDLGDREVPVANGDRLARLWPGAELDTWTSLGHFRILTDPDVVRKVTAFSSVPRTLPVP